MHTDVPILDDPIIIRYVGKFNYSKLYRHIIKFLEEHQYRVYEDLYKQKPDIFFKKFEVKWKAYRETTAYVKYIIEVNLKVWDFNAIEKNRDLIGNGRLEIQLQAYLHLDYSNRFTKNNWAKIVGFFYQRFMDKDVKINHFSFLFKFVHKISAEIKSVLGLTSRHGAY